VTLLPVFKQFGCCRQQHDAQSRSDEQDAWTDRAHGLDSGTKSSCSGKRPRRTTDVGAINASPICTDYETDSTSRESGVNTGRKASTARKQESAQHSGGVDKRSSVGGGAGASQRAAQSCSSHSAPGSIGIVPPAREATFLKIQERASERDRSVGKCVYSYDNHCCVLTNSVVTVCAPTLLCTLQIHTVSGIHVCIRCVWALNYEEH
jgi:hypothetical protein